MIVMGSGSSLAKSATRPVPAQIYAILEFEIKVAQVLLA